MLLLSSFLDLRFGGHFVSCARNVLLLVCFCCCQDFGCEFLEMDLNLFEFWFIELFLQDLRQTKTCLCSTSDDDGMVLGTMELLQHFSLSKISAKGGKQSWVFTVYKWIMLRSAIWFLKNPHPESSLGRKIREYVFKIIFIIMNCRCTCSCSSA